MKKIILLLTLTLITAIAQAGGPIVPWPLNRETISSNDVPGIWLARSRNSTMCVGIATPNPRSDYSSVYVTMSGISRLKISGWAFPLDRTLTGEGLDQARRSFPFSIFKVNHKIYMRMGLPNSRETIDFEFHKISKCPL